MFSKNTHRMLSPDSGARTKRRGWPQQQEDEPETPAVPVQNPEIAPPGIEGFGYIVQTMRAAMKPAASFDGKTAVINFLEKLDSHFMLYPVHEFQKVALATSALKGQALSWFKCIGKNLLGEPGSPTYTYENFKNSLVKAFPVVRDRARLEAELFSRYQERIEDLSNFILRKIQVFKLLYGSRPDPEIIQVILPRLLPQVQDFIELRNPTTLDRLFELAVQFESRRTADNERRRQFERRSVDFFSLAEAKIDFKGGELTLNMKPIEAKNDKPPQLDLEHLQAEEKEKIQGLVSHFANLFSDVPGFTQVVNHDIDTGDAQPVRQKPYRYDRTKEEIIEHHIKEMLKNKIITPISSSYASPVVLCKKNNDYPITHPKRWRFAIDYRKLNSVTKYPVYPLPIIEEIIRNISSTKYMTTLDLTSGYFQIGVKPEDVHKTAFITKSGTYAFLRMPFGLSGAPATFQRCMDIVLRPVLGKSTFIYLDDIIITSSTLEQHLQDLRKVFSLLNEAGLKINASKCKFAAKELRYLGFKISQKGIETDQSKIVAIRNYPVPKTAKKLSSFLGMCSYYRAFIKDFAKIAEPLLKLKRKKARFSWSAEANLAFQKLKDALTQAPVLKFPEGDKGLEISADASDFAIGAVLSQNGQPVAFFSRTLNETQRNYSATERETLAVLASVQKFRVFFGSSPVTVYTDHAAVTRLYSGKNLSPRLIRWALKLQEYNLIIKHTPGKENVVADALSRINLDENGSVIKIAMLTSKVLDSRETVIAELKKDPEFKNIYNYLADPENFNHPDIVPIRNRAENYELIDGLLFYTKATNENHEYRPVIPASMRLNVLEELHDCAISAHLGIRKTVQRVREAVFFPELQKFTRAYVQSCPTCQLNNYVNFRPAGFLNSIKSEFPNQIIGIDLLGPYPRSKVNKSRYLLVIVDHFSKWLELIPLKRASAKIVVDSILNKYILKYGAPLKVISDNGPQFVSKMFEEMCAKLGIRHLKMVPYRPQSNIAERVNRNVVKIIRSYVKNYHSTWDSHINEFAFALRTAKHDTTQKTPAELFLGRKILTPLDKLFFVQERAEEFKMSDIQKLIREATENIEMAQRKQKLYYDLKRREVKYNVGDEVLKIKHNLSNAPEEKVGKFFPRFEGPFTIEQITGAVVILKRNDGQTLKANVDQIKPFYNRSKMAVFKDSFQDPRQSTSQEDIRQQKQQEPATTASKCQKKKAPPQQRNKNQKGGFKRKSHDAGEQIYERNYERTKRRKQNGQGKPNVSKRTVESSDRCLRSKKRRLQPENQLPEYSRNQDKQRARAQERRAQSTKRPAEQPPLQRKLPRIQRRNFKRKRDEQAPKEQRKTRKLNQATTYSSFKDWAKKRMDDHNKITVVKSSGNGAISLTSATATSSSSSGIETQIRSRRKAAKMIISVVVLFGLCYMPVHLINTLRY
ncbi:Retrovirus-related Pol polyprotein from transposon 17.6, partial [Stegodyphus mimosarum]